MTMEKEKTRIETKRLVLRPLCREDASRITIICRHESITHNCLHLPNPYTEKDAMDFIEGTLKNEKGGRTFAIVLKSSNLLVGCIGLDKKNENDSGELGYWLDHNYRQCGYMTEAATAMIEQAFMLWGYHKITAEHFDFNLNSGKVMKKIGMNYEGTLVDHVKRDGQYITIKRYGIIKG